MIVSTHVKNWQHSFYHARINKNFYGQILRQFENPNILFAVVDLFAGAGGTSQGLVESGKAVVIACANHDLTAMESHAINHPLAIHFVEDIRLINILGNSGVGDGY